MFRISATSKNSKKHNTRIPIQEIKIIVLASFVATCFGAATFAAPVKAEAIPGPIHLSGTTNPNHIFRVDINWFSANIGSNNTFSLRVWNASSGQEVYNNLTVDFVITQAQNSNGSQSQSQESQLVDSHLTKPMRPADSATYTYGMDYAFSQPGSYMIKIENINNSGESITFPVQVTPEFPYGMIGAIASVSMAIIIVIARKGLVLR